MPTYHTPPKCVGERGVWMMCWRCAITVRIFDAATNSSACESESCAVECIHKVLTIAHCGWHMAILCRYVLLNEVNEKGGDYEPEKAYVHGRYELLRENAHYSCFQLSCLSMCPNNRSKQLPRAGTSVNSQHAQNLEEAQAAYG